MGVSFKYHNPFKLQTQQGTANPVPSLDQKSNDKASPTGDCGSGQKPFVSFVQCRKIDLNDNGAKAPSPAGVKPFQGLSKSGPRTGPAMKSTSPTKFDKFKSTTMAQN